MCVLLIVIAVVCCAGICSAWCSVLFSVTDWNGATMSVEFSRQAMAILRSAGVVMSLRHGLFMLQCDRVPL